MNEWLESLQPQAVWRQFRLMCDTPRPSFHEEAIRSYLFQWAQKLGLESSIDAAGNLLILKPATTGMERCQTVVLQGHLDMVAQKEADSKHNFETDAIETYEQEGWVHAKDTTLGADNGIGVAAILAVLAADDIEHGPLEALFTIEEETSLRGAAQLEEGILQGTRLLNLDSEDRGDVYIGCAGGVDINVAKSFTAVRDSRYTQAFDISITGLKGGHSGLDIHKGLANANVLLTRLLSDLANKVEYGLCHFEGGTLRNAIARDAKARICIQADDQDLLNQFIAQTETLFKQEFEQTDANLSLSINVADLGAHLDKQTQQSLIRAMKCAPNGVHRMSPSLVGVTETSCNFGVVRLVAGEKAVAGAEIAENEETLQFAACLLVRSLVDSQTQYLAGVAQSVFELIGCDVVLENGYPGWKPEPDSALLQQFNAVHDQVMGFAPTIKVIHAGLECGIIGAKYPKMEMVSFGPNIRGAHSPSERLEISSVAEFWQILIALLKATPKV